MWQAIIDFLFRGPSTTTRAGRKIAGAAPAGDEAEIHREGHGPGVISYRGKPSDRAGLIRAARYFATSKDS